MAMRKAPDHWGRKATRPHHQASLGRMVWEVLDQFLLWNILNWLPEDEGSVEAPLLREKGQSQNDQGSIFPST